MSKQNKLIKIQSYSVVSPT